MFPFFSSGEKPIGLYQFLKNRTNIHKIKPLALKLYNSVKIGRYQELIKRNMTRKMKDSDLNQDYMKKDIDPYGIGSPVLTIVCP